MLQQVISLEMACLDVGAMMCTQWMLKTESYSPYQQARSNHFRHLRFCQDAEELDVPDDLFDDEDESYLETGDPDADKPEDFTPECYDEYLTAKVLLPQGGEASRATGVCRKQDHDSCPSV